jgi:hypothetical protein
MANKYEWKIVGFQTTNTDKLTIVVQEVVYEITATSDDGFLSVGGGRLGLTEPDAKTFIEYSALTEQLAKEWVLQIFGGIDKMIAFHSPQLDAQIEMARSSKLDVSLPWA